MERKKESKGQKKQNNAIQVRLTEDYKKKLQAMPGKNNSERIRALIDGGHFLGRSEITNAVIDMKQAIYDWGQGVVSQEEAYKRIRETEEQLCRLLSTN